MTDGDPLSRDEPIGLPFPGLAGTLAGGDPAVAAPAGVAVSGPDVLLATKLHVPRLRPGFVPRPRLVQALGEGLARGLALVCAPAGFGKTGLLAEWVHGSRHPVPWLGLDAGDNDPARFWRYAIAALDKARPGLAERVGPLLGPPPPRSFEGLVTALINELVAQPEADGMVLVLDDYHLIDSEPVHASVAFLLEYLPPGLRLMLTSRADPPLPLARLRARGQLAELRTAELRFTNDEAAALLGAAAGPGLPEAAVAALVARTEGWAAGLQLAGLSLRGQPDAAGFVAAFSGNHRFVLDYLTDEVLAGQPSQVRGFLLETSVLDRLSGPLCDAVTGRADSQAMLEQAERAGLFLVPLDEVRGWWRYHHLFADLLRARLQQEQPGRVQGLHRAAAAWSEEHGLADDAVRHALAAGDAAWAARLVERHVGTLLRRSEGATLRRWLSALPAESVRAAPRLCLAQAIGAVVGRRVEAVEGLLDDAERAFAVTGDEPYEPPAGRAVSVLGNVPALIAFLRADLARLRGDAALAADYDRRALTHLGEQDWLMHSMVRWNLAVADWLRGRLGPAEHGLAEVAAERWAAGEGYLAMEVCYDLGQVQRARGNLDAALATYRQALETAGADRSQPPHMGMAHVGLAEVLYERDELAAALDHATRGVTLCRQLALTPPLAAGLAAVARIRQAHGDAAAALEAMGEAGQVELSPQVIALLNPVPSQRARLLLAQGDVHAAAQWAKAAGLGPDDQPDYPRESEYLVLARVLLAQDRPGPSLALLQRLLAAAASQGRAGSIIEIQALRALALAARDDHASALVALAEALTLAGPQRYVRVFADEGPPMYALLARLSAARQDQRVPARGIQAGYLAALVRASRQASAGPPRRGTAAPGMAEPLTGRELEVLRLLAAGRPNQRIARDLVMALDTVKKHVTHILGKLGAANRTEAADRARQLGLIP
jgi:LuxR family transcriptional regulator, maltose regulon positive regulatory protein